MRGHQPILAMRRRRVAPKSVWLSTDPIDPDLWRAWPEFCSHAHVQIDVGDNAQALDLRFLVGMLVFVDGNNQSRVEEIERAAIDAGAARVLGAVFGSKAKCLAMTDSEGALEWQP